MDATCVRLWCDMRVLQLERQVVTQLAAQSVPLYGVWPDSQRTYRGPAQTLEAATRRSPKCECSRTTSHVRRKTRANTSRPLPVSRTSERTSAEMGVASVHDLYICRDTWGTTST